MTDHSSLLLVGCGKMGAALLERWQSLPSLTHIDVIEPTGEHASGKRITQYKNLESLPTATAPSVIVFAVKPQMLEEVLPFYRARFAKSSPLYISIAAGKSLTFFAKHLGEHAHVVRVMPNTPAMVGAGMSVLCSANTLPQSARKQAEMLMKSVGKTEWVDTESLMDAVTALSGSGPAYVFLFLDSLTKAGVAAGLDEKLARSLAVETVSGSIALAQAIPENFERLRKNVTSPGGTTEAALKVLMSAGGMEDLVKEAILAAKARSIELKN